MQLRLPALLPVRRVKLLVAVFLVTTIFIAFPHRYNLQDTLSYSTRPLWDSPLGPQKLLTHQHSPSVRTDDAAACRRHGWQREERPHVLWDATLISTELDMMEIRLRELWDAVDKFIIMESTHSMTGVPKNLSFLEHRARFEPWSSKIEYKTHQGRTKKDSEGLFALANEQRMAMTDFIESLDPPDNLLLLMADIDEVPYEATLHLLKACQAPFPLHLQLQNYLYSFEFPTLADSWRAQIHRWSDAKTSGGYRHGMSSDYILAAAGWHCSFCFRDLWEFAFKMLSASHVDRLLKRPNFRKLVMQAEIQRRICAGKDLYGMLPEAYSWTDLIRFWSGPRKEIGNVNLPRAVVSDFRRFAYLLPCGCLRNGDAWKRRQRLLDERVGTLHAHLRTFYGL